MPAAAIDPLLQPTQKENVPEEVIAVVEDVVAPAPKMPNWPWSKRKRARCWKIC